MTNKATLESNPVLLFPGQGSQFVGMGKDLIEKSQAAKDVYTQVNDALGRDLTKIIFDGPEKELNETKNAQPAITATSLACLAYLNEITENSYKINYTAGHSLGEYTSLAASGALTIDETIKLVVERGRLMQIACNENPGGMVAIIGVDELTVEEVCRETGTYTSNINSISQIVISGDHMSLARAIDLLNARGAKRVVTLPVSGAFHSELMQPAVDGLTEMLDSLNFTNPKFPIISNVKAKPIEKGEELKQELINQMKSCVQWSKTLDYLIDEGCNTFIEIGPGKVLTNLIKRIPGDFDLINISDYDSANKIIK
ncbi:MAG: [acyl-carrier-protein] S-malonyltransferase [Dehalococcoidia bacterium]|nr:[acyl-carrier-protein] S-malonyltransferase [Dehalococcoidia bacterium]|tara:strand:- start:330 stop:1271 length:942 start_codon:yes stop_codon:yes gene_type:complete